MRIELPDYRSFVVEMYAVIEKNQGITRDQAVKIGDKHNLTYRNVDSMLEALTREHYLQNHGPVYTLPGGDKREEALKEAKKLSQVKKAEPSSHIPPMKFY